MIDPVFLPEEMLYRRVEPNSFPISESSIIGIIPFPDCSVNRSKYSQPKDILMPDCLDWGVLGIQVIDVPTELRQGETFSKFAVIHCPVPENYAHSEIRSYKIETQLKEPSRTIKLLFRDAIRRKAKIIISPSEKSEQ